MKPFDEELVSGSIVRSVWKLAWPIVLMNLINGIRGLVDQILIGHFVEHHEANTAVGLAWSFFLVVVVSLASLFQGMGVLIAQSAGKQDRTGMNRILFHTGLMTVYAVLLIVIPLGYAVSPWLLEKMRTTDEVRAYALPYLRILFLFGLPLGINFLIGTAMQSSGDPKTPLFLIVLTTILHLLLSSSLITGIGPFPKLGVMGAALGAGLAPIPSVLIGLSLIVSGKTILGLPDRFTLIPDWGLIGAILRIGIPTGIHAVVLNIGGLFLYGYIGVLETGSAAQAAYTLCYLQLFSFVTWAALGIRGAASALMGQNVGAGKSDRGKRGVHVAAAMGVAWALLWGIAVWIQSDWFLGWFNADDYHVVEYGETLLRYLSVSGIFLTMALAFTGGLMGVGDTVKPMIIGFATQIVLLLGVCEIFRQLGLLTTNSIWFAILLSHLSRYLLTHAAFHLSKGAPLAVELRH